MQRRKRRDTSRSMAVKASQLQALLGIGLALVALLRAIDPQWQEVLGRLVQLILTRPDH
jgi:hypothetical protein